VTLSLPLTLAITTVVLGEVDGELLALPLSAVERVVRVDESEVESMGDAEVFTLLGQTVPLIRLDDVLGTGRPPSKRPDACYVTVLRSADRRIGLTMDRMRGQREVVIKSLGTMLREVPLIAGATLLGDQCVLILNPAEVSATLGKPIARAAPSVSRTSGHRRVLLVDDDTMTRIALRRIFEQAGLEVQEASDGLEALETARERSFAMVSTDVVMPRMDGYALTRELRKLEGYERVPIVMISSKDQEVDRRAGFEAGVDHYVTKPFDRSALLALVEEVVS
jgi:CheY-like chemotaxis protein/chemotaxis signal transduction protein